MFWWYTRDRRTNGKSREEHLALTSTPMSMNSADVAHLDHMTDLPLPESTSAQTPAGGLVDGLIVDGSRGMYRVDTPVGVFVCTIRGRLRKQLSYPTSASGRKSVQRVKVNEKDPVAVGDRVRLLPTGDGTGVIEEKITGAGGAFTRADPGPGQGGLTVVSGIDQIVAVFAAREPTPHLRLLDRFLALAESQAIAALICVNKADLGIESWLAARLDVYRALSYAVVETSAASGAGLDDLRGRLGGLTSAFVGPSGVGKSSLLNALEPDLGQRVSAVSGSTGKGRHTTTGTRLVPLAGGGYLADTAGIRALALSGVAPDQLDQCFREFRPYLGSCRLSDCTHLHEPDCAVRAALRTGTLDADRFESYRRLRESTAEDARAEWTDDA
jgi:ribosome biogenesis GTPase